MGTRTALFLHGLDSSGRGTKGSWFRQHFPEMLIADYEGELEDRLEQLQQQCLNREQLVLVGSSFGGLMATVHCSRFPEQCARLVLLAPALNFADYVPPATPLTTPTHIIIGKHDTVTPPDLVLPLARQTFATPRIELVEDDHMLHAVFYGLDWPRLLG